ncbi:MAG: acyltransferase, partial [Helicobacteraceae bacterium]|nr:acyltransferase [Helicobacteraceae bacterium]
PPPPRGGGGGGGPPRNPTQPSEQIDNQSTASPSLSDQSSPIRDCDTKNASASTPLLDHSQPSKRFRELDFIRGAAAICVVYYHWVGDYYGWKYTADIFFANSFFSVDIFFILSGFVMSYAYGKQIEEKMSVGRFALIRLGRLYPLVVVASIAAILATWLLNAYSAFSFNNNLFMNLFLFQGLFGKSDGFITVFWSIGVEFWVGLTLFYGVLRYRVYFINFLIVLALIFFEYGGKSSLFFGIDIGLINNGTRRGLLGIGLGIICYQIYLYYKDVSLSARAKMFIKYGVYILFAFILFYMIAPKKTMHQLNHVYLKILVCVIIVFAALLKNQCKLFCAKWQSWLGDISYSVYVLHSIVIWFTTPLIRSLNLTGYAPEILGGLFVLTITLIVSHYTHKYIEMPAYKWFKGKIGRT